MQSNSVGSPRCCCPARCSAAPLPACPGAPGPAVLAGPAPASPCLRDEPLVSSLLSLGSHPRTSVPTGRPPPLRQPLRPEPRPFAAAEKRNREVIRHI